MKLNLLSILTILAVISACMRTRATIVDPGLSLARLCPQAVRLYITPDRIKSPYREVALLHTSEMDRVISTEDRGVIKSMREQSAKLGANGIILSHFEDPEADLTLINASRRPQSQYDNRALAVYVAADSAYSASVCSKR
jgi:hypothetical protein